MFRSIIEERVLPSTVEGATARIPEILADLREGISDALTDRPDPFNLAIPFAAQLRELSVQYEHLRALRFLQQLAAGCCLPNFIDGQLAAHQGPTLEVFNPSSAEVLAKVPLSTELQVDKAVSAALQAQPAWGAKSYNDRIEVLFRLHTILEERKETLAYVVHLENGKTLEEARASVDRGIACLKTALSLPFMAAEMSADVGAAVNCQEIRIARGICAGITPFNFPIMVPLWMAPLAIGTGNAFILKPSEQTPISATLLAQYFREAGIPNGIFSVVHGAKEAVQAICDHQSINAIGFVGSSAVAKAVYDRATANGKVVRALGGAKNHIVVMPDADPALTIKAVINSSMGCSGQRCMAGSVLVAVGNVDHIIDGVVQAARELKLAKDIGPVINENSLLRIQRFLAASSTDGTTLLLDGRLSIKPEGLNGYYIGASIIDNATIQHPAACQEIFGPVLTIVRCSNLEEAIAIENNSVYGNAACIFTDSAKAALRFRQGVSSGMIGVNIGVPVPSEPFPFGGMGQSLFGEGGITGIEGMRFWTQTKKVTTKA